MTEDREKRLLSHIDSIETFLFIIAVCSFFSMCSSCLTKNDVQNINQIITKQMEDSNAK